MNGGDTGINTPKVIRWSNPDGRLRGPRRLLADADLAIAHDGTVIKDRHGHANRKATASEMAAARVVDR